MYTYPRKQGIRGRGFKRLLSAVSKVAIGCFHGGSSLREEHADDSSGRSLRIPGGCHLDAA